MFPSRKLPYVFVINEGSIIAGELLICNWKICPPVSTSNPKESTFCSKEWKACKNVSALIDILLVIFCRPPMPIE